ncbi:MAG: PLP-dependent aminotransferase family protein [Hyphomicrobiales bacterium]|nr:PLP-dependent aminotransferase family protein [Hyphomicrobiales bacterium]
MPSAPLISIAIDPAAPTPLFQQVYEALRRLIISGQIASGSRLPASRPLAGELSVSRTTIVAAYDQLAAEGFIHGCGGSGVFVTHIGEVEIDRGPPPRPQPTPVDSSSPGALVPFQPGRPDMRLFPYRQWARCVARVARASPQAMITLSDVFGDLRLRTAIARHLTEWRGLNVSPEQVLVTAGAGDALEMCIRTLTKAGDRVALEDPGYPPLRRLVRSLGMKTAWLDVSADGTSLPRVEDGAQTPLLAILTPSYQFPLGGAMPAARRMEYLKWAADNGAWILEDDYDSEFRYAGRPIPALTSFDRAGRAIYIGSFSKIFSEGLRLGFLVVPETLIQRFESTLTRFGTKTSMMPQRCLATFMEDGEFHRHIRRMRRIYGERRDTMISLIRSRLGHHVTFEDHHAGMQIALRLTQSAADVAMAARAASKGLICPALSPYCARDPKHRGLLLGFCGFSADEMEAPAAALQRIIEDHLG